MQNEILQELKNVVFTLRMVKVDDTNGNWGRILACKQTLEKMIEFLSVPEKEEPTCEP